MSLTCLTKAIIFAISIILHDSGGKWIFLVRTNTKMHIHTNKFSETKLNNIIKIKDIIKNFQRLTTIILRLKDLRRFKIRQLRHRKLS